MASSDHEYRGDGCLSCERADAFKDFWIWFEAIREVEGLSRITPMQLAWLAFQAGWHLPPVEEPAFNPPPSKETQ